MRIGDRIEVDGEGLTMAILVLSLVVVMPIMILVGNWLLAVMRVFAE